MLQASVTLKMDPSAHALLVEAVESAFTEQIGVAQDRERDIAPGVKQKAREKAERFRLLKQELTR